MDLYTGIAAHYDEIFPLDPAVVRLVDGRVPEGEPRRLLDVGCATGSLAEALAPRFDEVHGLDLDAGLIAAGTARRGGVGQPNVRYHVRSMIGCAAAFSPQWFSGIACLGNTLAHLGGPDEAAVFLANARLLLRPGGVLLVQIVNYDRVMDRGVRELPTLETPSLRFERNYSLPDAAGHIRFAATLTDKLAKAVFSGTVSLFPFRAGQLAAQLAEAGFDRVHLMGGFDGSVWMPDSFLTVLAAS